MDALQRSAIMETNFYRKLVQYMDDNAVLDFLHRNNLFTQVEVNEVRAKSTLQERNCELIRKLTLKRENEPFKKFLDALDRTNQKNLADDIRFAYINSVNTINGQNAREIHLLTQNVHQLKIENQQKTIEMQKQLMQKLAEEKAESQVKFEALENQLKQQILEFTQFREQSLVQGEKINEMRTENEKLQRELETVRIEGQTSKQNLDQIQKQVQEIQAITTELKGKPAGLVPLHRLFHNQIKDHYYTASKPEADQLNRDGWEYQGLTCQVWPL